MRKREWVFQGLTLKLSLIQNSAPQCDQIGTDG